MSYLNRIDATGSLERNVSIYTEMIEAGVPTDSHESDLYALVNDKSREIVQSYDHKGIVKTFVNTDGKQWYDIPFAYDPFWAAKNARSEPSPGR